MMMIGMFILLMSMKFKWHLSLIGAIAWGFSSYFVIIIGAYEQRECLAGFVGVGGDI